MEDYTIFKDGEGAYRDVRAGDTPYGPPNCLCLFSTVPLKYVSSSFKSLK